MLSPNADRRLSREQTVDDADGDCFLQPLRDSSRRPWQDFRISCVLGEFDQSTVLLASFL
jgi:hypothetical protein